MDEGAGAFEVTEELQAEACPVTGALDQPGDVGQDEGVPALQLGDPEIRMEGRERVRRDLRLRSGERRQQRRLATVRQPDQTDVGDQAKLEVEVALLARVAQLAGAGRLARGRGEAGVATTAASTPCRQGDGARSVEVGEHDVPFPDDGSDRNVQGQVRPMMAGTLAPTTGATVLGAERAALPKTGQRCVRRIRNDEHIAAASPVAAVRAAVGDVLLASKADSSPPA